MGPGERADKGNGEIQGSLHYGGKSAASGRDDVGLEWCVGWRWLWFEGWRKGRFLRFAAEWKAKRRGARFEGFSSGWCFGDSSKTRIPFGNDKPKKGNAGQRGNGSGQRESGWAGLEGQL